MTVAAHGSGSSRDERCSGPEWPCPCSRPALPVLAGCSDDDGRADHLDTPHGDVPHVDGRGFVEVAHEDTPHGDGGGGSHADRSGHGDHGDHGDRGGHGDRGHADAPHADAVHTDTTHDDHADAAHADAPHADLHGDHGDTEHADLHADHGDSLPTIEAPHLDVTELTVPGAPTP